MTGRAEYLPHVDPAFLVDRADDAEDWNVQAFGPLVPGVRDPLGNIYIVGSTVVYGTTSGRSPVVKVATVWKITPVESQYYSHEVFADELPEEEWTSYERSGIELQGHAVRGHPGLTYPRVRRAVYVPFTTAKVTVDPVAGTRFGKTWSKSSPMVDNILRFDSPVTP